VVEGSGENSTQSCMQTTMDGGGVSPNVEQARVADDALRACSASASGMDAFRRQALSIQLETQREIRDQMSRPKESVTFYMAVENMEQHRPVVFSPHAVKASCFLSLD